MNDKLLRPRQPASCAPPCMRGLVSRAIGHDGRRRRRRGGLPRGLRIGREEPVAGCRRHGGAARKTAAAATDMSDTEKIINWSNWTEYIDVDDKTKSRPDPRRVHEADRHQGQLLRGLPRQRRVLRQGRVRSSRAARTPAATSGAAPTGWSPASSARATSRSSTSPTSRTPRTSSRPSRTSSSTRAGSTRCPGRAASPASATTSRPPAARRSRRSPSCSPTRRSRARSRC